MEGTLEGVEVQPGAREAGGKRVADGDEVSEEELLHLDKILSQYTSRMGSLDEMQAVCDKVFKDNWEERIVRSVREE